MVPCRSNVRQTSNKRREMHGAAGDESLCGKGRASHSSGRDDEPASQSRLVQKNPSLTPDGDELAPGTPSRPTACVLSCAIPPSSRTPPRPPTIAFTTPSPPPPPRPAAHRRRNGGGGGPPALEGVRAGDNQGERGARAEHAAGGTWAARRERCDARNQNQFRRPEQKDGWMEWFWFRCGSESRAWGGVRGRLLLDSPHYSGAVADGRPAARQLRDGGARPAAQAAQAAQGRAARRRCCAAQSAGRADAAAAAAAAGAGAAAAAAAAAAGDAPGAAERHRRAAARKHRAELTSGRRCLRRLDSDAAAGK